MSSLPKCMKVLIKEEEKPSFIYKDIPVPQPNTGDLLVKVLKVSICGSDTVLYQWNEGIKAQHLIRSTLRMMWNALATDKVVPIRLCYLVIWYPNYCRF